MTTPSEQNGHSYEHLKETFEQTPLFEDKTWKLSPHAWPITQNQLREIETLGQACLDFHKALETLYLRSTEGKNLLRNKSLIAPWVADYLDRGKPHHLVKHGRCKVTRGQLPSVIRPDLLVTEDGFALTEIDSVPGGIGLTAFLNRLYADVSDNIIGDKDAMLSGFYKALAAKTPDKHAPMIVIVVSDEAATYRPEMAWVCEELQKLGKRVYCFHPDEVYPLGEFLHVSIDGNPETVDVIYRFYELFDLPNLKTLPYFFEALEQELVELTPPMRAFQEEKLSLGLFHHGMLAQFWREHLPKRSFRALSKAIPKSWVMDHTLLPPTAVLDGPLVGGNPIREWTDLNEASQKERNLIIKISGFHETAWGARSVTLGSDFSRDDWSEGIQQAVEMSDAHLHVLQEYQKPQRLSHPVYADPETTFPMQGRIRLCPYFFVDGDKAVLSGILATFCPADKKIIHGMRDAAMLPCQLVD
ncbi:hypothetical protein N9C83_00460 [Opitutales bacterium]|nr:hypothetical protein [Opitutales bacterium]